MSVSVTPTQPSPAPNTDALATARAYLASTAGLCFDGARRSALVATLQERAGGAAGLGAYVELVSSPAGVVERQALLDAVTVQETSFFRNPPQMEALRRVVLPELLRRAASEGRPFLAWSAGCATGEEPYTMAMLALEVRAALHLDVEIQVLGTDLSAAALDIARTATYAGRTVGAVPPAMRTRWFCEVANGSRVSEEVRDLVSLRLHNLVTDAAPWSVDSVDLVLCRNVTIYFARRTTRAVIGRLTDVLRPEGYLVLGHAETLWRLSDAFTLVPIGDAFAYRKIVVGGSTAPVRTAVRRMSVRRARPEPAAPAAPVPAAPAVVGPAESLLAAAREALSMGRYAQAVLEAARAVDVDPLRAPAWSCLGQALTCRGRDADAVSALRKAVYLDPGDGSAHFLLAGALARLGHLGAASVAYAAAAVALPRVRAVELAHVLDGRDVHELAALCHRLAVELGSGPARRVLH